MYAFFIAKNSNKRLQARTGSVEQSTIPPRFILDMWVSGRIVCLNHMAPPTKSMSTTLCLQTQQVDV